MFAALLCCLYLQGGFAYMFEHPRAPHHGYWFYDINKIVEPYGNLELGYTWRREKKLEIEFALRHESSVPVGDFGQNTAELRLRWYPYGR